MRLWLLTNELIGEEEYFDLLIDDVDDDKIVEWDEKIEDVVDDDVDDKDEMVVAAAAAAIIEAAACCNSSGITAFKATLCGGRLRYCLKPHSCIRVLPHVCLGRVSAPT